MKLIVRAAGKVRIVSRSKPEWLMEWRVLAAITNGITKEDPRFESVMAALAVCEEAFGRGNWEAFRRGSEQVQRAARV